MKHQGRNTKSEGPATENYGIHLSSPLGPLHFISMVLSCFCLFCLILNVPLRHRSHRQSGRRKHTLTPQHFDGKSKPLCRPGGGGGEGVTCRYLDQSQCPFHLVCCCGCWEQTWSCVSGFLISDPSPEHELSSQQAAVQTQADALS